MKKTIGYLLIAAMSLNIFSGCADMLEEKSYGNPTTDTMLKNEENVVLLVGQAYAELKWVHDHWGYWGVSTLTSDEGCCPVRNPDANWDDGGYWKNLNTHKWNEQGKAFKNIWNTTISGAVLCNKLLKTLDDYQASMSEAVHHQYVGELEVLRSYYYYLLFDCFGRIPYVESFDEQEPEPLMEPEMVWSNLVECIEKNAPNMPVVTDANRASNYGRVTQGFAYALLARLYLNAESFGCTPDNISPEVKEKYAINSSTDFYTNAVRCCDLVINSGSYKIEDNYFDNFRMYNEGSKENIFVIVENGNASFDLRDIPGSMCNKLRINMLTHHYCMQDAFENPMLEKPWNGFCARPTYLARFADSDVRGPGNEIDTEYEAAHKDDEDYSPRHMGTKSKHEWGWFLGGIYDPKGERILVGQDKREAIIVPEVTSLEDATWIDGARLNKYELDKEAKFKYCENDFVLMRYADVLWMKEEAILRGGQGTSAQNSADFRKMLSRTFAYDANPYEKFQESYPEALTLEGILDERGREFSWELVRRRDLIRFGKFNQPTYLEYVTATDEYRKWFPIPYSVLEKSLRDENGNPIWTQNPGYPL